MSHYRNDTWTLDDGLGLGRAGDQVARMALEVDAPFTIGVTGKWGSGKTSVMRRAVATFGVAQHPRFCTIQRNRSDGQMSQRGPQGE